MAFAGIKPTGDNIDIAWKWNSLKDISNKKKVVCDYCGKVSSGGISRAKQHQLGIKGQVTPCATFPDEYKQELREAEAKKKGEINSYTNQSYRDEEEEEELQEIANIRSGKRLASMESSQNSKKGKIIKGPMDLLLYKAPESTINKGNDKRQQNIKEACEKEARARTIQYISRFFCTNGIAFNVVRSKSFKLMVEAIGNYGPHLKAPSYHEMRVPLLKKELDYTKELMKNHEDERVKHGCSIMSDGWTDRKRRTLINFLVNSPAGSMFVRSVDASDIIKTGAAIFELLDNFVEEIGEKNVVQVITDNGSNFRLAGELLEARRKHLFWTPCAAHCIDLMLEDIGKISKVKKAIQNGISLVSFVYNHSFALSLMRKFTNKTELVKHGVTRFATSFLTLTRLNDLKRNLRKMFTSEEWSKSKLAKDRKGKNATSIVISPTFWNGVGYTLKVMKPLVDVLRLVDNEKKPAMGYIYEAMDRAKVTIQNKFKGDEEKYKDIFAIIDTRWECQLHHPLHAAGLYLNPNFYFNKQSIEYDSKVTEGLYKCIERLGENIEVVDKIMEELLRYKAASGMFGIPAAIRQRTKISPAAWWGLYGSQTPNLQKLAIKVLSLTCSSSGCERNWSIFEHIHSKKRSKLEHQNLQDLVYIKYNQALKDRFDCSDLIDPIVLNDIDDSNEWLVGRQRGDEDVGDEDTEDEDAGDDLVFEDDNLTWRDVDKASGASEPLVYTRQNTRSSGTSTSIPSSSSGKGKGKQVMIVEEDFDDDTSEEDDEEHVYKDSSDENDEDDLVVRDD